MTDKEKLENSAKQIAEILLKKAQDGQLEEICIKIFGDGEDALRKELSFIGAKLVSVISIRNC